ncbi:hypothetical protein, partial [Parageobacillus thermoglucosidasius]|uniref:hypothetical protein n=1 Tax=Parageobacillus thermoglucosidasius TaxID=1426 RepID=UPI0030C730CD
SGYLVFKERDCYLVLTSLLSCAEESIIFEFVRRRRRKTTEGITNIPSKLNKTPRPLFIIVPIHP